MSADALAVAAHHLATSRPEAAIAVLDAQVGELTPYSLRIRAAALLSMGRDTEARTAAERGLALDPDDGASWSLLSSACTGLGDLAAAERASLAALRLRPDSADLMAQYSRVLAADGQTDKAHQVLERAASLDPESLAVFHARTFAAMARGDDRAAVARARDAVERDPQCLAAHAMLGAASALRGDAGNAVRHTRRAAAGAVGNRPLAEAARESRIAAHWSMLPLRALGRFGPGPVWIVGVVLVVGGSRLLPPAPALVLAGLWLAFCLYSWTAPWLLRRWARSRW